MDYQQFVQRFGLEPKAHQDFGVKWCLKREKKPRNRGHGGLIADEMGLGKTYQIMAVILGNLLANTLIICPVALLDQWSAVLEQCKTENSPEVVIYRGSLRKKINNRQLSNSICLTSYGEISRRIAGTNNLASPIHSVSWNRIVFDEAHHMRNSSTIISRAGRDLRSPIKWLLTGTPIQNSFNDFHSLCSIIGVPTTLYSGPLMNLTRLTNTYILKRTKVGVGIKMPILKEENVTVNWSNKQEEEVAAMIHNRIGMSTRKNQLPNFGPKIVDYIRARQMCVYPALLNSEIQKAKDNEAENDGEVEGIELMEGGIQGTSKLGAVINMIKKRHSSDFGRKIVFCEYKKEMEYLETELLKAGILALKVDGTVRQKMRKAIFESEITDVLLLQIRTCSEGLNLQQFTEVYIVTPQWNPCIEAQAICRSYRMGQDKPVTVFRFMMDNDALDSNKNMENHILAVQDEKKKLMKQLDDCK